MGKVTRPSKMFQPGVKSLQPGVSPVDEDTEGHRMTIGASSAKGMQPSGAKGMQPSGAKGMQPSGARVVNPSGARSSTIGAAGDDDVEGHRAAFGASNAKGVQPSGARGMQPSGAKGIRPSSARSSTIGARGDDEDTEGHKLSRD